MGSFCEIYLHYTHKPANYKLQFIMSNSKDIYNLPNNTSKIDREIYKTAYDNTFLPCDYEKLDNNLGVKLDTSVRGYDFTNPEHLTSDGKVDYSKLIDFQYTTGFQATNLGKGIQRINEMIECKLTKNEELEKSQESISVGHFSRKLTNCTIFFTHTSNLMSSGLRDTVKFLAKENMIDTIITTCGAVEEDLMKVFADHKLGDFALPGKQLLNAGINRQGNLLISNENYLIFMNWMVPILEEMSKIEAETGKPWTPSGLIWFLGKEIGKLPKGEESVWYWCYKNKIPVFSPALTDGSLGDMLYFFSYKRRLNVEIVQDLRLLNSISTKSCKSGMIICGGGLIKHHTCNANLMRNGADYAVYINTATEFDGSDSGASPDEAISWGKIRMTANPVKIICEVTLVLPLLIGKTFYEYEDKIAEFDKKLEALRAK